MPPRRKPSLNAEPRPSERPALVQAFASGRLLGGWGCDGDLWTRPRFRLGGEAESAPPVQVEWDPDLGRWLIEIDDPAATSADDPEHPPYTMTSLCPREVPAPVRALADAMANHLGYMFA